jgi:D-beta-D-heptose 7-phosphate kinase/D-beta-D-heptose 1-phosphate adenosyltransferase
VPFAGPDPTHLIEAVKPDVLVKGAEYHGRHVAGAEKLQEWGGKLSFAPMVPGASTTALVRKARGPLCRVSESFHECVS